MNLPYSLTRTVYIEARPETVFRYFTDSERWASWWGKGSAIEARVGGQMLIVYPNAIEAKGEVLEVAAPERIVFTYGYASGNPIPAGSSKVTIRMEETEGGTTLHFLHEFGDPVVRDQHVQGWRYHLSVFSNVVANALHADAAKTVEAWYAAWAIADDAARGEALAAICAPDIRFQDRFSNFCAIEDLNANIGGVHRFMPGIRIAGQGSPRHCQGTVLSDWTMTTKDGTQAGTGTNVFHFDGLGRIRWVIGVAS